MEDPGSAPADPADRALALTTAARTRRGYPHHHLQCCPASNDGQGGHLHGTTRASIPTARNTILVWQTCTGVRLMCLKSNRHRIPARPLAAQSGG